MSMKDDKLLFIITLFQNFSHTFFWAQSEEFLKSTITVYISLCLLQFQAGLFYLIIIKIILKISPEGIFNLNL